MAEGAGEGAHSREKRDQEGPCDNSLIGGDSRAGFGILPKGTGTGGDRMASSCARLDIGKISFCPVGTLRISTTCDRGDSPGKSPQAVLKAWL